MPQVSFSVDEITYANLERIAKKHHCSMAESARMIVQQVAKEMMPLRVRSFGKNSPYSEATGKMMSIPVDGVDIMIGVVEVDGTFPSMPGQNPYEEIVVENFGVFRTVQFSGSAGPGKKTRLKLHVVRTAGLGGE